MYQIISGNVRDYLLFKTTAGLIDFLAGFSTVGVAGRFTGTILDATLNGIALSKVVDNFEKKMTRKGAWAAILGFFSGAASTLLARPALGQTVDTCRLTIPGAMVHYQNGLVPIGGECLTRADTVISVNTTQINMAIAGVSMGLALVEGVETIRQINKMIASEGSKSKKERLEAFKSVVYKRTFVRVADVGLSVVEGMVIYRLTTIAAAATGINPVAAGVVGCVIYMGGVWKFGRVSSLIRYGRKKMSTKGKTRVVVYKRKRRTEKDILRDVEKTLRKLSFS